MKIVNFWVVTQPKTGDTIADIRFLTTIQGMQNQFLGGLKGKEIIGIYTTSRESEKVAKAALAKTHKKVPLTELNRSWDLYKDGTQTDGYVAINNESDVSDYVFKILGVYPASVTLLEKGRNYPYNRSNPYYYDDYSVKLANGTEFKLERRSGSPNWNGKVRYIQAITIK